MAQRPSSFLGKQTYQPWIMWAVLLVFFMGQFVLRVSAGVMADPIMDTFTIDATEFGLLTSFYYLGYASLQLPLGILLDRYGPRFIATLCILVCAFGAFVFALSTHWYGAILGRLLIGMGSSGAFISTSKSVRLWFAEDMFTKIIGITVTLGLFGALNGSRPVAYFMEFMSWQSVLTYMGSFVLLLGILCFAIVRNPPSFKEDMTAGKDFSGGIKFVLHKKELMTIAILGALLVLPLCVFADVWGVPFFTKIYGWSRQDASTATSFVYFGMCFGSPVLAFLAERHKSHKTLTVLSGIVMGCVFALIAIGPVLSYTLVLFLMFVAGIFCAYQVLVFSMVSSIAPRHASGVAIGFTNMINMTSGLIFLPLIGGLIDQLQRLAGFDLVTSYRAAMMLIPLTAFLGAGLFAMARLGR